ncbi:hypothetical protein J1605_012757 [Eschrichtius robustus]|uniref:Uncharacterized protein n=1 Tax=Eschrichtius robustus TaxID=9764 RepID=A0AB34GLG0_ESCRO|nr:hypothetical protein J1605_012757 [Eschrichtius robustus]
MRQQQRHLQPWKLLPSPSFPAPGHHWLPAANNRIANPKAYGENDSGRSKAVLGQGTPALQGQATLTSRGLGSGTSRGPGANCVNV